MIESVEQLAANGRVLFGRRVVLPVDAVWFDYIHKRSVGDEVPTKDGIAPFLPFKDLHLHFTRIAAKSDKKNPAVDIWDIAGSTVLNYQPGIFMAPMCSPLTRVAAQPLADTPYWVTEKSDGLRVVLVSIMADFPRWSREHVQAASPFGENLYDNAQLEQGFSELCSNPNLQESSQLRLTFGVHTLKRTTDASTSSSSQQPLWRCNQFVLCRKIDGSAAAGQQQHQASEVHTLIRRDVTPRHFSYLFDRAMDATYMLLDEYVFSRVALVVLDGELMLTAAPGEQRQMPIIGFFDVFAFTPITNAAEEGRRSVTPLRQAMVKLQRRSMSERYEVLREVIFNQEFTEVSKLFPFNVIRLFCKRLYAVSEMMELLSKLKVRKEEQPPTDLTASSSFSSSCAASTEVGATEFIFCGGPFGPTRNDGLIFTPDAFDIMSGSCETQLKWKYPSMLSADWLLDVVAQNRVNNPSSQMPALQRFRFSMYFKKRRRPGEPELFGHSEFSRSLPLEVAGAGTNLPTMPFVAECRFNSLTGNWSLFKLRSDKKDANSVVTIISVLESQCEKITLQSLCNMIGADADDRKDEGTKGKSCGGNWTQTAEVDSDALAVKSVCPVQEGSNRDRDLAVGGQGDCAPLERPMGQRHESLVTHFIVRATQEFSHTISLTLQFLVKLPDHRNALVCNHRRVSQCYGLGEPCPEEDSSSLLEQKIFIALANGGGSYAWSDMLCDAVFDASRGRWVILELRPNSDKNLAYATRTIQYLMDLARLQERGQAPAVPPSNVLLARADNSSVSRAHQQASTDEHYMERTKLLSHDTDRSNLRLHNNWIKSVLIETAIMLIVAERQGASSDSQKHGQQQQQRQLSVLDLCCGRGGDLPKWRLHRLHRLVMIDSCAHAVAEAAARYSVACGLSTKLTKDHEGYPGVVAKFHVRDCFASELWTDVLEPHLAEVSLKDIKKTDSSDPSLGCTTAKFDIVSCQFSMHYAFNSEERVRAFLKNVSNSLAPGGVFVGTTVHDVEILRRRDAALAGGTTSNDSTIEFGNSVYRATFSAKGRVVTSSPSSKHCVVGEPYTISVEQSVAGAEEYIVPWKAFVHLCAQSEYNLKLVECDNFDVIAKRFENTDMGQRIMRHVCGGQAKRERESVESVVSGGSIRRFAMSEDEAETAKLFRGFIFQKV